MLQELRRKISNALAFGSTTSQVSTADGNVAQVQVRLNALEVITAKLVEQRGFASNMPVGTPVIMHFHDGDRGKGVVNGSAAPASRPALTGPEDAAVYGYTFTFIVKSDGFHMIAPSFFITGNLHVTGEIDATAGISSMGDVVANSATGFVSLVGHVHPDEGAAPPTPGT